MSLPKLTVDIECAGVAVRAQPVPHVSLAVGRGGPAVGSNVQRRGTKWKGVGCLRRLVLGRVHGVGRWRQNVGAPRTACGGLLPLRADVVTVAWGRAGVAFGLGTAGVGAEIQLVSPTMRPVRPHLRETKLKNVRTDLEARSKNLGDGSGDVTSRARDL